MAASDLLTLKQLADYLQVNERTVLKLASEGAIPAARVGSQWRFRKALIDAWIDDQAIGLRAAVPVLPPEGRFRTMTFSDLCRAELVRDLEAGNAFAVVTELAELAGARGLVRDATWYAGGLVAREGVMSTAHVGGTAVLHTLHRHPEQVNEPFLLLGRSLTGVPFGAPDGKPTHLFFALGLRYSELHLPWLMRLVSVFSQADRVAAALAAPGPEALLALVASALDGGTPPA